MFKTFTLFALAILLSASILGPSFLALLENEAEIEVVQDLEEESNKENIKEVEEGEKFFNDFLPFSINRNEREVLSAFFYQDKMYGHITDVHSPPPEQAI